ncbi:hypothetical protein Tco_0547800 [Tanacetum coccineum]
MHNNIMVAGSKDLPPMLGPGRYSQWRSRFLWYIDTKINGEGLTKCILSGPYVPSTVLVQAVAATEGNHAVLQHTTIETVLNMTPENKEHFQYEKEAIFLLLTGIGDEIYSTVDACNTANEMWIAIEKLQQGESLNVQIISKVQSISTSCAAQPYSENKYLLKHQNPQRTNATSSFKTKFIYPRQGKEIAKPVTPQSETVSDEDNDPEQAQMDKEMQKNLALLAKYFKKLYKPTNNNLRTSSNPRNKTEDTPPRYNNDNQSGQFGNQRKITVAGARETVGDSWKPKRVKDYTYHKEKMMMCKQVEQGVPLQVEQADWLEDTDEEIDEQELEAQYSFMAKIQEVLLVCA